MTKTSIVETIHIDYDDLVKFVKQEVNIDLTKLNIIEVDVWGFSDKFINLTIQVEKDE